MYPWGCPGLRWGLTTPSWTPSACELYHQRHSQSIIHIGYAMIWHFSSNIRLLCNMVHEPGVIEGPYLKAQKNRIQRKTGFIGRYAHVGRVIPLHISSICAYHNGNHERLTVDCIAGDDQNRTVAGLFATMCRIKIDEVDMAPFNRV